MKRLIYGLLSLFAALLLIRASSYGTVGRLIAHTSNRLIGSAGVALVIVILLAVAFHLIVPRPIRKWLLSFPELFHRERAQAAPREPRAIAAPKHQLVIVAGGDVLQQMGLHGLMAMAAPRAPAPVARRIVQAPVETPEVVPTRSPSERMRLADVETALKGLGYRKEEYRFVQEMDGSQSIETLVREALVKLRV